jgi:predicted transcriptional regulator
VVVKDRNEIKGIISSRSILKAFGKNLDTTKAKDILIPYTVTVTQDTPLADTVKLMQKKKVEHIIVISAKSRSKVILGVLSASDIVRHMAQARKGQE